VETYESHWCLTTPQWTAYIQQCRHFLGPLLVHAGEITHAHFESQLPIRAVVASGPCARIPPYHLSCTRGLVNEKHSPPCRICCVPP
jgi:hypothetical protein